MKKRVFEKMSKTEQARYFMECARKSAIRNEQKKTDSVMDQIKNKVNNGERLTVEDFEILTGIMFSHNMTGKMENILALSTNCLVNPICKARIAKGIGICKECYAAATTLQYDGLCENTSRNYEILSTVLIPVEIIPEIVADELRIEAFGDVGTVIQAMNYINFARYNPNVAVTAWTKNPGLYKIAFRLLGIEKPENFTLILSSPNMNKEIRITKDFEQIIDKTFTVYTLEYLQENNIPESFINCGGRNCKNCQRCYKGAKKSEKRIHELLKKDTKKAEKSGFTWSDMAATENNDKFSDIAKLFA